MKSPPVLSDSSSYEDFKKEIEIWRLLKVCSAEEEGPMVFRTLTGKAKTAALRLTVKQIGAADGLDQILAEVDKVHLDEKNTRTFECLEKFEQFHRGSNVGITEFMLEFASLYSKLQDLKIEYPPEVVGYKLLKAARLSPDDERIVKATIETGKFCAETVEIQLKKVVGNKSMKVVPDLPIKSEVLSVKQEAIDSTTFYGQSNEGMFSSEEDCYYGNAFPPRNSSRGIMRGYPQRSRNFRFNNPSQQRSVYENRKPQSSYSQNTKLPNQMNTKDRQGNVTKCRKCKSLYHWLEQCPHASPEEKASGMYNSYYTQEQMQPQSQIPQPINRGIVQYQYPQNVHSQEMPHYEMHQNEYQSEDMYPTNDAYFITDCKSNQPVNNEIYIGLFQNIEPVNKEQLVYLVKESLNMAVIDSGCPKTVCGKLWYENFKNTLQDSQEKMLIPEASHAAFRFGDSKPVQALFKVNLPLKFKGKQVYVATEVVPSEVPLLLSKNTMKQAGANIDFRNDKLALFGIEQPLVNTSTGHYAIPVQYCTEEERNEQLADIILLTTGIQDERGEKENQRIAKKLHCQFNHAAGHRIVKLMKDAGNDDEQLINEVQGIEENCEICKRFKKTPVRPVVTFPLANRFNETIQLDLKTYIKDKVYFLHIIDHKTRLSAAAVIYSKKKEVIIEAFFRIWIGIYGHPDKVLVDNGGEFVNQEFIDCCENLNIKIKTTAAESAWSNGICEKYNGIIGEAVKKVKEEVGCSVEIALAWAVNAKNCLHNIHGFSPYQMVFGQNPNLPLSLTSRPPALEGVSSSELVRNNLNAMHKARQEFIRLESCDKLRRAMRARVRTHGNTQYQQGDEVYYKRDKEERWRGPARVVVQEGSKVLLKCVGNSLISVHTCRLQLCRNQDEKQNESTNDLTEGHHSKEANPAKKVIYVDDEEGRSIDETDQNRIHQEIDERIRSTDEVDQNKIHHEAENLPIPENHEAIPIPENQEFVDEVQQHEHPQNEEFQQTVTNKITPIKLSKVNEVIFNNDMLKEPKQLPKIDQHVQYKLKDDDKWMSAKILGRAGKANGPLKFWLNIEDLDEQTQSSLNWKDNVKEWKVIEYNTLLTSVDTNYDEAKKKELKNWKDMKVYTEVIDNKQPAISVRWVYTKKLKEGVEQKKARLVARGYEENDANIQKDSPTCHKESLRTAIIIIASLGWQIRAMDIKSAFLQGKALEREIFIKPPKEAEAKDKLWLLNRCVYGLNDASRYWYLRVYDELTKAGCHVSKLDPAVFYYYTNKLEGLLVSHVDDFLYAGTKRFGEEIERLKKVFQISKEDANAFKYVGIEIQQVTGGIHMSQIQYTRELQEIKIKAERKKNRQLAVTDEERQELRSVIGQLSWLSIQTRPDLSYDVCEISNSYKEAIVETLAKANKVIRRAKMKEISLFFPRMNLNNIKLVVYTDASHANLPDAGSQGGIYLEVVSGEKRAPLFWQSKRIRRVVKSSMAAETLALIEGIESAILMRNLLSEILFNNKKMINIEAVTDSKSVFDSAYATNQILDKGLRVNMSVLREFITLKEIEIRWVPTNQQLANVLTKTGCDALQIIERITSENEV